MRSGPLALGLIALLACGGCSELARYRECRGLADTANPMLSDIEAMGAKGRDFSPLTYSQIADQYRNLKRALRTQEVKDQRLDDALDGYLIMLDVTEKQLRQSSQALATNGAKRANKAQGSSSAEAEALLQQHREAMAPILAQQTATLGKIRSLCKP